MNTHARQDRQDTQAGEWLVRLRSGAVTEQERRDFALWLAADAANASAFDRVTELWEDLGVVSELPLAIRGQPHRYRDRLAGAMALAACLLLAALLWPGVQDPADYQHYRTGLGEQRTVVLDDGSEVMLNTRSSMIVAFSDEQRSVELAGGEAFFSVSDDPGRPFVVDAGSAVVTVIGTAFNIRRDDSSSEITVNEGVVRVVESGAPASRAPATEVLHPRQQLRAEPSGLRTVKTVDSEQAVAWRRGEIVAQAMSLPALAAEIRRYHDLNIVITDPAVAEMTVSGIFSVREPDAILRALQLSLGLEVEQINSNTLRLLKTAG
jgi:transmembrane sensor